MIGGIVRQTQDFPQQGNLMSMLTQRVGDFGWYAVAVPNWLSNLWLLDSACGQLTITRMTSERMVTSALISLFCREKGLLQS